MCQNEDIVAIDAELVGVGKRCQIRSGDQRCTLFAGRPLMWCRLLARAVLQRTQHFGGLKIPTWRDSVAQPLRDRPRSISRATRSVSGQAQAQTPPHSPPSCYSLAPSAGAGRSSASSDRLFWFHQPKHQFTHIFPIASVLIGVGEKPIPKLENWIRSAAHLRTVSRSAM